MIKDPERDESSIDYLGKQETNDYSMLSAEHGVGADMDSNNHIVDSDNSSEISDPEIVNNVLFASDNIPLTFKKSNVTVISDRIIPGVKTIDDDIRYTKSIGNYQRTVFNSNFSDINDYELMISNFERRASNGSLLILRKSNFDMSIRKISIDKGLGFHSDGSSYTISQKEDKFKNYNICGNIYSCINAKTDREKSAGLQTVDFLSENEGMCFGYDKPRMLTFAMKSVSYPIDIIFCSNGVINKISHNVQPGDMGYYGSIADTVIELNGGTCKENNIVEGGPCFETKSNDYNLRSLSSYDVYFMSHMIKKSESMAKVAGSSTIIGSDKIYSDYANHVGKDKYFFSKKASYFEPVKNNFVLINDTDLSNSNAKKLFSFSYPDSRYSIIKSKSKNLNEISNIVMSSLSCSDCRIFDLSIDKSAAFPVPNSTKKISIDVDKEIIANIKRLKAIVGKLEKNKSIYEKNKDNFKAISGSSGVFRQSMKKMAVNFKSIVYSVKVIIKSLNKIKDTTNIEEIVNSMLVTTQNLSKFFKDLLDLQDKTDSMNFYSELEQKTDDFIKISEDLETVMSRARDFIWNHILGKSLLTD